ncbi:hypothetical protein O7628_29315 [Micromonospora sp. WMMD956]|uniref:hypothetical protein n=1 Tax=Micromonospora sp. WMMD956 TaxID=3016108 RepID=UPI0024178F2C|nr:hypothetical protein [Micromonospora sp. WMMD956]MDG4819600.1 hypothetical protein [Micromonospora sp. WMMD956]
MTCAAVLILSLVACGQLAAGPTRLAEPVRSEAGATVSRPSAGDDFSLAVVPGSASVVAGNLVQATVRTITTTGAAQAVSLTVGGLPAGTAATVEPAVVASGGSAVLTVRTSVSTRAGTYDVVVAGAGASARHTVVFRLVVRAPAVIRAAFYYPWFPEAWRQQGLDPFTNYVPVRGRYAVEEPVVRAQVADMRYGGITMGIASWFGRGTVTDRHWPAMVRAAQGTGFVWAPYYEPEGTSDPTPERIADDLHYLRATYGGEGSALAVLPDRGMPVFVYNSGDLTTAQGCATVDRWVQAQALLQRRFGETVNVNLKVFPGYPGCSGVAGVAGWHQYGPAKAEHDFSGAPGEGSYTVSPGFWKAGLAYGQAPFLSRDRARWRAGLARMNASGAPWQLVTTYNEWGEGTAIESSRACRGPAPAGTWCDWSGGGRSDFISDLHDQLPPARDAGAVPGVAAP